MPSWGLMHADIIWGSAILRLFLPIPPSSSLLLSSCPSDGNEGLIKSLSLHLLHTVSLSLKTFLLVP